jgi:lipoprotein-releasing system ATP-binding protein
MNENTEILLDCKSISKYFKEGENILKVIDSMDFQLPKCVVGVIRGSSGAGKSTLLHLLGGLDTPTKGDIFFKGKNLSSLSSKELDVYRLTKVGFVFQFHHLLPEFTLLENVLLPAQILNGKRKEDEDRAKELIVAVGLSDRMNHLPSEASGGEKQRIAIARSLINNPEMVFMDEPSGNLDGKNSQIIHDLILKLNKELGFTFLIVTHDDDLAAVATQTWSLGE